METHHAWNVRIYATKLVLYTSLHQRQYGISQSSYHGSLMFIEGKSRTGWWFQPS